MNKTLTDVKDELYSFSATERTTHTLTSSRSQLVIRLLVAFLEVNMLVLTHVFGDVTLRRASMGLL